jgi:hypothetical protein
VKIMMDNEDQEFIKELCIIHRQNLRFDIFTSKGAVERLIEIRHKYGKKVLFAYVDGFNAGHQQAMDKVQAKLNQFKEVA